MMTSRAAFLTSAVALIAPACIELGTLRRSLDDELGGAAGAETAYAGEKSIGGAKSRGTGGDSTGGSRPARSDGGAGADASGGSPQGSGAADADGGSAGGMPFLPPAIDHKPIDAGWFHTCVTSADGTVMCWGNNSYGQLGDGSNVASNRPEPAPVVNLSGVTKISAGNRHTCALLETGLVRCFGADDAGQLGDGAELATSFVPKDVIGVERAIDIDAGASFNCALIESGEILCWGSDSDGQLGNNLVPPDRSNPPTKVHGIDNATAVVTGGKHACARLNDRTAKCWGWNAYGQIGSGRVEDATRSTPDVVRGLDSVVKLAAGAHNTCAILEDGTLWCWGYDGSGALGDGSPERTESSYVPSLVPGLTGVLDVSIGEYHICALLSDGHVRCWGADDWGQVGDTANDYSPKRESPVDVAPGFLAAQLALGSFHSCARGAMGQVACWGHNEHGSVGSGSLDSDAIALPTRVKGF